jgi:hypothetical protein
MAKAKAFEDKGSPGKAKAIVLRGQGHLEGKDKDLENANAVRWQSQKPFEDKGQGSSKAKAKGIGR